MAIDKKRINRLPAAEIHKWLILVLTSLIVSVFLFPNFLSRPEKTYRLGDIAEEDVKATGDLLIEDKARIEKDREAAINSVPYIYDYDPSASHSVLRLKEAMSGARRALAEKSFEPDVTIPIDQMLMDMVDEISQARSDFFRILETPQDIKLFEGMLRNGFSERIERNAVQILEEIFKKGIVTDRGVLTGQFQKGIILQSIEDQTDKPVIDIKRFNDVESAREYVRGRKSVLSESGLTPEEADLTVNISLPLIKPNVTFNKRETELRKDMAGKSVNLSYYQIKKGEMIVREGERIGQEHLVKLSADRVQDENQSFLGRVPGMALLIALLLYAVYITGFLKTKPSSDTVRNLLFNSVTLLTLFIFIWLYDLIAEEVSRGFHSFTKVSLIFSMPVACGAMLIAIFQGLNPALSFSIVVSILASLIIDGNVEYFVYFFISSISAAYFLSEYRDRGVLIKAGLKVGVLNMAMCLAIGSIHGTLFSLETPVALVAGFAGGLLSGVISTGIIPLVEMSFGFTTNIKLLELANLDQPLLRELMVQAPGSYHHSVIVSNMVEATAKAINANPLLAKVSAYYHDIGKVKKPMYFIENQMGGENRHEKLAPSMSSLVLISHVKDGVELAKKNKLGKEITDIIQQHHGKGIITFFYQKARENAALRGDKAFEIKEEDFRYPGPKPQTKEAGLVMLADMVEAASRSLPEPTPSRIQGIVQKIINRVFSDGQLDECELTLKDLHEIAKSFNKTLSGIFHHRVEYPDMNSIKKTRKAVNGDTDQGGQEDIRAKKSNSKEPDAEGLKRLGM